eukprot:EC690188.1.p5 GENE.EC690188.1~~EC690188.1.p5  ORF type:complete len:63 (-),score=2.73 EC690188.1:47-235(-)
MSMAEREHGKVTTRLADPLSVALRSCQICEAGPGLGYLGSMRHGRPQRKQRDTSPVNNMKVK